MTYGTLFIGSALISIVILGLMILLDISDFRHQTVGEYILMFLTCCVPIFNFMWIFFGGASVLFVIFSKLLFDRKWFIDFVNKKPFEK
jgi:hypothetical protein